MKDTLFDACTIAIVAGEASGDTLGAGLMREMRTIFPNVRFIGVGGPKMQAQGLDLLYDMELLSVVGLSAVLKRLPALVELRRNLLREFIKAQPAAFVGVDAPDFNLGLARRLHEARIRTVHYVSPSVWAWRQRRIVGITRSIDLMLTLFPFEREFYSSHGVTATHVGHPAAHTIELVPIQSKYRAELEQNPTLTNRMPAAELSRAKGPLIAVLPGSRNGEIDYLLPVFVQTMQWLLQHQPDCHFVLPCVDSRRRALIEAILARQSPILPLSLVTGDARAAMGSADVVLLASGTATLEALLLKRPMVVAYKWHWLTHFVISRLVKLNRYALPNILVGEAIVPECIQNDAKASKLGPLVLQNLAPEVARELRNTFTEVHRTLLGDADLRAAEAVADLVRRSRV